MRCLLVENYSNSRQVWSSRSFLQFLCGLRANSPQLSVATRCARYLKCAVKLRRHERHQIWNWEIIWRWPNDYDITAFTSLRTNLSPFTKGCREWDASMWLPKFLRAFVAQHQYQNARLDDTQVRTLHWASAQILKTRFEPGQQKGLRERNSPICTLSQNGYGDSSFHPCGCRAQNALSIRDSPYKPDCCQWGVTIGSTHACINMTLFLSNFIQNV